MAVWRCGIGNQQNHLYSGCHFSGMVHFIPVPPGGIDSRILIKQEKSQRLGMPLWFLLFFFLTAGHIVGKENTRNSDCREEPSMPKEMKSAAEYQEEMLRLYQQSQKSVPTPEPVKENPPDLPPVPEPIPLPEFKPEPEPTEQQELPAENAEEIPQELPLPELFPNQEITAEPMAMDAVELSQEVAFLPEESSAEEEVPNGYLKVITRTGNDALPMAGVMVSVTEQVGMDTILRYMGKTNESGETERISLPAAATPEKDAVPYFRQYDVSVYREGYFRIESRGLPIFSGITSLQKFSMIPLPQDLPETTQTIVYREQT